MENLPRKSSLSSTSDESSSCDLSSSPSASPCPSSNDDYTSSSLSSCLTDTRYSTPLKDNNNNNPEYHVLYLNLNGSYFPIAQTSFIIQTAEPANNSTVSTMTPNKKSVPNERKKNFSCTYSGCTKSYFKSSHLKAHFRLHTGKY